MFVTPVTGIGINHPLHRSLMCASTMGVRDKNRPKKVTPSLIQCVPVISPFPLNRCTPAQTGCGTGWWPRGRTAVTPVRTGPSPTRRGPSPFISVVKPTSNPGTSVIAFKGRVDLEGSALNHALLTCSLLQLCLLTRGMFNSSTKSCPS